MFLPGLACGAVVLGLLFASAGVYHYFAHPEHSRRLASWAVALTLTASVLCSLLIPVDIYSLSAGTVAAEPLRLAVSQAFLRDAYFALFATLLALAFCFVPLAFFCAEEAAEDGIGEKARDRGSCGALRSTVLFLGFMLFLMVTCLTYRPRQTESWDKALASRAGAEHWVEDLLDAEHQGLNAVSFAIACLTLIGVLGWVCYTAYGMAALPFAWIRGRQSPTEQRREVESSIELVKERCRTIQARYPTRADGSLDVTKMRAADRREVHRLQSQQKSLSQQNYILQECELKEGMVLPRLLQVFVPCRFAIGLCMLGLSLLVSISLFLTLVDRALHSDCGFACGYSLKERRIFNPADDMFMQLSRTFPLDFLALGGLVLYVFGCSVFGIVSLGIRVCFKVYVLRPHRSQPQALLMLCNFMSYILLALCMAMLTIAPDYVAFGAQRPAAGADAPGRCTLERKGLGSSSNSCRVSVIAGFFAHISVAMPLFSVIYFFANWAFIAVFAGVFVRCLFCQPLRPYIEADSLKECEEEELGLLTFHA